MEPRKTILVMDDDPYACAILEGMVQRLGYTLESARDCEEAIARLRERTYDGVLIDAWLESEQGEGLLKWIRAEQRKEPVIMMSDMPTEDLWVELIDRGASDLIAKPIQLAQIQRTFRMAIEKKCLTPLPQPVSRAASPPSLS